MMVCSGSPCMVMWNNSKVGSYTSKYILHTSKSEINLYMPIIIAHRFTIIIEQLANTAIVNFLITVSDAEIQPAVGVMVMTLGAPCCGQLLAGKTP